MSRKKLVWQIYPFYFIILVGALLSAAFYSSKLMQEHFKKEVIARLDAIAQLLENNLSEMELVPDNEYINQLCLKTGAELKTRITVVAADGSVLGDSYRNPVSMENHKSRPEIAEALTGVKSVRYRFSSTSQQEMVYVAIPILQENKVVAVVRTAVPTNVFGVAVTSFNKRIIWSGIIIILLATLVSFIVFHRISGPLADLKEGAERFARGEFQTRLAVHNTEEIGGLAESMNKMAEDLNERISTIVKQRNEQQALLASMIEGVLAVDADENVININRAAAGLLNIDSEQATKRSIYEVFRQAELHDFVEATLKGNGPLEKEILIQIEPEKVVQAHGSVMTDSDGDRVGAVIVLNDVTHLKRLENIRKDFVANVSHELKTPITSIRGFVETLLDGAMDNPDDTKRFLEIIIKQADRLNSIVDDLLTLSRIEKETEKKEIEISPAKVREVLSSAVLVCEQAATAKGITLELAGDESIMAGINRRQFEQAVINLIDNAVKYSDKGSRVRILASATDKEITVAVIDQGIGIDRRHLPRIFERFYRVDKSRSREVGGTGLGLAIVKHVAIAHGGRVSVESTPGKGSTFTIHVPSVTS